MADHSEDGAGGNNGGDIHDRVRVPRRQALPDVEATEIIKGAKPGSRFARRVREGERRFARSEDEGTFRATEKFVLSEFIIERCGRLPLRNFDHHPQLRAPG